METWEKPSSKGHHRKPSFSSTLLDQIYRSIDDSSPPLEPTRKKKLPHEDDLETSPNKLVFHRRSMAADYERSRRTTTTTTAAAAESVYLRYSNSTSSDSSGVSSSSSFYGRSKSSASPPPQPKPIRTSGERPNTKQELGGFLRTKSKALKIYTDLKKVKQPISPGGRLATFLNSLFTNASTNNPKKPKKNSNTSSNISVLSETQSSSSTSTTCSSSASSFSRSCLSKTPSSSGKSKRSVRFCPVNVILDEDSSLYIPCGNNNNNEAKRYRHVMEEEENRRVIEAAKDLIRTYQKKKDLLAVTTCDKVEDDDDDDDDDAASCASSDLFELENLSAIGIDRYQEELPVYETTRLDNTNRAIATSLIV